MIFIFQLISTFIQCLKKTIEAKINTFNKIKFYSNFLSTMFFRKILLLFCSTFLFFWMSAQDQNDFESWTSVGIEKKLFDKTLTLSLSEQVRLENNSSNMDLFFTQLGIKYQFFKNWSIAFGYRLMRENEGNKDLSKHSRWHTDLSFKHKMNRFGISYRFRFQQKSSISENYLPINKMRFRLKTSYNIKDWKWDPYFTSELFHIQKRISIENYVPSVAQSNFSIVGFEKIRFSFGTSKKVKNLGKLNLFYRFEHEFNGYPYSISDMEDWSSSTHALTGFKNWHIIGLNFNFNI